MKLSKNLKSELELEIKEFGGGAKRSKLWFKIIEKSEKFIRIEITDIRLYACKNVENEYIIIIL